MGAGTSPSWPKFSTNMPTCKTLYLSSLYLIAFYQLMLKLYQRWALLWSSKLAKSFSKYAWELFPKKIQSLSHVFIPPSPCINTGGGILESLCPSVLLSVCLILISLAPLNQYFTKFGMVVYYHEVDCHAEKLVHYLQCQGHSEGLYNQNCTICTISFKLLVSLQPTLIW